MHSSRNIIKRLAVNRCPKPALNDLTHREDPKPNSYWRQPQLVNCCRKLYTKWFNLAGVKQALLTQRSKFNLSWLKFDRGLKNRKQICTEENDSPVLLSHGSPHSHNLEHIPCNVRMEPTDTTKPSEMCLPDYDLNNTYDTSDNPPLPKVPKQKTGLYSRVRVQSLLVRARR